MGQSKAALLGRPYSERQLIIVIDDKIVELTRATEEQAKDKKSTTDWSSIGMQALKIAGMAVGGTAAVVAGNLAYQSVQSWIKARESGLMIVQVSKSEASSIQFPPGHPRDNVLYVGHPAVSNLYYVLSDFHRITFEHKCCEAIDLLMSLGATKIRVEHIKGWSREFSSRLSIPLGPTEAVSGELGSEQRKRTGLLYEATLDGLTEASLPEGMFWYPHEPTWQITAKGRLKYGLSDFSLTVNYEDDFGINAGLKTMMQKTGLELGGKFEDHVATVWKMSGEFRPALSQIVVASCDTAHQAINEPADFWPQGRHRRQRRIFFLHRLAT